MREEIGGDDRWPIFDKGFFFVWPVKEITLIFFLLAALHALSIFFDFPLDEIKTNMSFLSA